MAHMYLQVCFQGLALIYVCDVIIIQLALVADARVDVGAYCTYMTVRGVKFLEGTRSCGAGGHGRHGGLPH